MKLVSSLLLGALAMNAFAAPTPVVATPTAPAVSNEVQGLRSQAYNTVMQGITVDDANLADLWNRPNTAFGSQQIAIEAGLGSADKNAAVIFNGLGGNVFGQFKVSDSVGVAHIGWANAKFGVGLLWGDNTTYTQRYNSTLKQGAALGSVNPADYDTTLSGQRLNSKGHQMGLTFGTTAVSNFEVFGSVGLKSSTDTLFKPNNLVPTKIDTILSESYDYKGDNLNTYQKNFSYDLTLGIRNVNSPAIWDIRVGYSLLNQDSKKSAGGTPEAFVETKSSTPTYSLNAEIGQLIPTKTKDLRPYLGFAFGSKLVDPAAGYVYSVTGQIKTAVEYQIFEKWSVLGGYTFGDTYTHDQRGASKTYSSVFPNYNSSRKTSNNQGVLGLTYRKDAFAVETQLAADVSDNGPSSFFVGRDILMNTSAIWNF